MFNEMTQVKKKLHKRFLIQSRKTTPTAATFYDMFSDHGTRLLPELQLMLYRVIEKRTES
jgi:hypothetical protein